MCVPDTALVQRQATVATYSLLSPEWKGTNLKRKQQKICFITSFRHTRAPNTQIKQKCLWAATVLELEAANDVTDCDVADWIDDVWSQRDLSSETRSWRRTVRAGLPVRGPSRRDSAGCSSWSYCWRQSSAVDSLAVLSTHHVPSLEAWSHVLEMTAIHQVMQSVRI